MKIIRVWAGRKGSQEADEQYRQQVVSESQRIADLAAEAKAFSISSLESDIYSPNSALIK